MSPQTVIYSENLHDIGGATIALESAASWLDAQAVRSQGAVYTPDGLAQHLAEKLVGFYRAFNPDPSGEPTISALDPACGDGQLLHALRDAFEQTGLSAGHLLLTGSDIDSQALDVARQRLGASAAFFLTDALRPLDRTRPEDSWRQLLDSLGRPQVDLMIANPPWGATLGSSRTQLERAGYHLAKGQFDSSDLFVELATRIVRPSGLFAFIVPDSLFAVERVGLRSLLLSKTQLLYVARLGEGMFASISRGCALVVCRNSPPVPGDSTECLRLNPTWRKAVLQGAVSLRESELALGHTVSTSRFRSNPGLVVDLDVESRDASVIKRLRGSGATVSSYLESARGVELSKHGRVVFCPECERWSPTPRTATGCPNCGQVRTSLVDDVMVSKKAVHGYEPFIVGEDIGRHVIKSNRWIDPGRPGINYKQKGLYADPKLLVRKTGVGISAAMDYSGAYTNQVVYVFRRHAALPQWVPLEFAAALICSRAAYYHLVKTHGETEWRSHPYVTQKHILDLPAPRRAQVTAHRKDVLKAAKIVSSCSERRAGLSGSEDAELERIVATVLGLTREDYEQIYRTLNSLQELAPVRALKTVTVDDIF